MCSWPRRSPSWSRRDALCRAWCSCASSTRMRPDIAELVSDVSYREAPLGTPEAVRARPRLAGGQLADRAVVLVDTGPLGSRTARAGGMSSRYNVAHAQLAGLLLARGIAFSNG